MTMTMILIRRLSNIYKIKGCVVCEFTNVSKCSCLSTILAMSIVLASKSKENLTINQEETCIRFNDI